MLGLMQDWPLLLHRVIDYAAVQHGRRPVTSRRVEDGTLHRTTYAEVRRRALRLAKRLAQDDVRLGVRVGTLAWNTWRHLEVWYGVTGIGAIYHTVNPRLFEEQILYIVNHAEDRLLFLDLTFLPLAEKLQARLPTISPGCRSTRTPRRACATPRGRPASPRACCTRTVRTSCTRSPTTRP